MPKTPSAIADAAHPSSRPPDAPQSAVHRALLMPGGEIFAAPENTPLLLAAQHSGISMTSSCRNGTCRACLCILISGAVTYCIAWPGVSADEKRDGLVLPCVACAASDVVLAPLDDSYF